MAIGDRLNRIMMEKGIKQRQLAKKAGVSRLTIAAIQQGKSNPTQSTILRLAEALNLSVSELLGESPALGPKPSISQINENQMMERITKLEQEMRLGFARIEAMLTMLKK